MSRKHCPGCQCHRVRRDHAVSGDDVLRAVSNALGVSFVDLTGVERSKTIVRARHVVALVARHACAMSYPEIAALLDRQDHTTAMHAVAKAAERAVRGEPQSLGAIYQALNVPPPSLGWLMRCAAWAQRAA